MSRIINIRDMGNNRLNAINDVHHITIEITPEIIDDECYTKDLKDHLKIEFTKTTIYKYVF